MQSLIICKLIFCAEGMFQLPLRTALYNSCPSESLGELIPGTLMLPTAKHREDSLSHLYCRAGADAVSVAFLPL